MKKLLMALLALSSLSAFAATYDCGTRKISVKTSMFSGNVTSIDDKSVSKLSDYVSSNENFGRNRANFEERYDLRLVAQAFAEDYRIIEKGTDETGYSRGFFEKADKAFIMEIDRPSLWCYDACYTYFNIKSCTKI